jgi:transcriptional regulator with XRE-family HTH domain
MKKKTKYIAKKIKALRKSVGWSQSELARKSDVTSSAINLIEKGNRMPSLIVSRKIAKSLNISTEELTGDELPSSYDINEDAQVFFRKYGDLEKLSSADQEMIKSLIKRLKDK